MEKRPLTKAMVEEVYYRYLKMGIKMSLPYINKEEKKKK
jgi:hypothetical protein